MNFNDAGRFDARAQNVLLRRHVVFRAQSLEVIEEASNRATHMSTMSTRTGKLATCGAHSQAWRLGRAARQSRDHRGNYARSPPQRYLTCRGERCETSLLENCTTLKAAVNRTHSVS